jgi:hypothetical protein
MSHHAGRRQIPSGSQATAGLNGVRRSMGVSHLRREIGLEIAVGRDSIFFDRLCTEFQNAKCLANL